MQTIQRIWNYQLVPPVPWYYIVPTAIVVIAIGVFIIWRLEKREDTKL